MSRRLLATILTGAAALSLTIHAQQPAAFEAASVRPNRSTNPGASSRALPGGRVAITNRTLTDIIREVYQVQTYQIAGGPDWADRDRWDIVAKGEGDPSFSRVLAMMQTLLADRFKLAMHHERREMPIYALVRAGAGRMLGPQITPADRDCRAIAGAAREPGGSAPPPDGHPRCGVSMKTGRLRSGAATMADVARNLSYVTGRMTVDKTGLEGSFDLDLTWNDSEEGPSLFTAIQEQLGLKLEAQRGAVDVLVIDSAGRPTED